MADLSRSLLPQKLRALHDSRRSGVLVVSTDQASKALYLRGGHIVFASSTLEKEKLGENLIRLGRISRSQFLAAHHLVMRHAGEIERGPHAAMRRAYALVVMLERPNAHPFAARQPFELIAFSYSAAGDRPGHDGAMPLHNK